MLTCQAPLWHGRDEIALFKRISQWEDWIVCCTAYSVEYVGVGNSTKMARSAWKRTKRHQGGRWGDL
jgi:hypothetical protein